MRVLLLFPISLNDVVLPVSPACPHWSALPGSAAPGRTACCRGAPQVERNVPEKRRQARPTPRLPFCWVLPLPFQRVALLLHLRTPRHEDHAVSPKQRTVVVLLACVFSNDVFMADTDLSTRGAPRRPSYVLAPLGPHCPSEPLSSSAQVQAPFGPARSPPRVRRDLRGPRFGLC